MYMQQILKYFPNITEQQKSNLKISTVYIVIGIQKSM